MLLIEPNAQKLLAISTGFHRSMLTETPVLDELGAEDYSDSACLSRA
jgi:hypothetical protein